ncbi:hypothetical protein [Aliidongia dinghuensis]|uniref:hypothetical protein n=1 Tax=Aliidongia dinghuensis TaxID=1867774 RepID=UPI0016657580|nr:hypothetical protein [Aliidongia dinghuensis]
MTHSNKDTGRREAPIPRDAIDQRIGDLTEWLNENSPYCFADQAHLDENSRERAYWHYGYLVALMDVVKLLDQK